MTMRGRLSDGRSGTSWPVLRPPRTSTCAMTSPPNAIGMYLATDWQRAAASSSSSVASPSCCFGARSRACSAAASSRCAWMSRRVAIFISRAALLSRRAVRTGRRLAHCPASMTAWTVEKIRLAAESSARCARRYGRTHSGPRVPSRRLGRHAPAAPCGARPEPGLIIGKTVRLAERACQFFRRFHPSAMPEFAAVGAQPSIAQAEPTITQVEPTIARVEPTIAQVEPAIAQVEPAIAQVEPNDCSG